MHSLEKKLKRLEESTKKKKKIVISYVHTSYGQFLLFFSFPNMNDLLKCNYLTAS